MCKKQLEVSKCFLAKGDDFDIRIAIILIDNTMEVLFRNIPSSMTGSKLIDDSEPFPLSNEIEQSDFKDLLKGLLKSRKIDRYQKFVLVFMHRIRNLFYHNGFPVGLVYVLKVPDLLKRLTMVYINLALDLLINLGDVLPKVGTSDDRVYSELRELKYDFSPATDFNLGAEAFIQFFVAKWEILIEIVKYVMKHTTLPSHPDAIFKWGEFWRKGYKFKTPENLNEDFKQFKSEFKYEELINIGNKIIRAFQTLKNEPLTKNRDKIGQHLEELNVLLSRYERMVYTQFVYADWSVQLKIDQSKDE